MLLDRFWLPALIFLLVTAFALTDLWHRPSYDELYHVLAARGWLEYGEPRIADGVYPRAQLFTMLIAWCFRFFGESLVVARLPVLLAAGLLTVAVFLWTRSVAGTLAAVVAALLFGLSPLNLEMSQFIRFYTVQALAFWLGAIGLFALVTQQRGGGVRVLLAGGAIVALAVAAHLQLLTYLGLAGLALWAALTLGVPVLARHSRRTQLWVSIGVLGLMSLAALAIVLEQQLGAKLLQRYLSVPLHAAEDQSNFIFYHLYLLQGYATIWAIFPLILLIAMVHHVRAAWFCVVVFGVSLALLSGAGMKGARYMYFVMPFFFVIVGIALAASATTLRRAIIETTDRLLQPWVAPGSMGVARTALVAVGLLFIVGSNGAIVKTALIPLGVRLHGGQNGPAMTELETRADWAAAKPILQPLIDEASIVLTSRDLQSLYYFGRYDILISESHLSELGHAEFSVDDRTGRLVIGAPESLNLIFDCYRDGIVVADTGGWRVPTVIDEPAADVIEARTVPIVLAANPDILAFRWDHRESLPRTGAECSSLPTAVSPEGLHSRTELGQPAGVGEVDSTTGP